MNANIRTQKLAEVIIKKAEKRMRTINEIGDLVMRINQDWRNYVFTRIFEDMPTPCI